MQEYTLYYPEELPNFYEENPDESPIFVIWYGKQYYCTRETAIELGIMRDPNKPLTLRERITEKIQNWHSRMAVWHERRSIGLR